MAADRGDNELRELLRRGDPAAGDGGLQPGELARMRRAAVEAATGPARSGWLRLAFGTAVAVGVLLAVVWVGRARGPGIVGTPAFDRPPPRENAAGGEAAQVGPTVVPPPREIAAATEEKMPDAAPSAPAGGGLAVAPVVAEAAVDDVVVASSDAERRPRQIQFIAPGGTRIIWTLDPNFKL